MENRILKYPRTPHIQGSRMQAGDEDLSQIPFSSLQGKHIVVEEKIDGANVGISFSGGELLLQSRGHFLRGGAKERDYELFKLWATAKREELYSVIGERYIVYGEWMYRKHKIYYNALPHFFLEFDIYDKEKGIFLDTGSRKGILNSSVITSVPTLYEGKIESQKELLSLLGRSRYITDGHISELTELAQKMNIDPLTVLDETDGTTTAEGLYIKVEAGGAVIDRMKFVRQSYLQTSDGDERWHARPVIPNKLKAGSIFD